MKPEVSMRMAKWSIERMKRQSGYICVDVKWLENNDTYLASVKVIKDEFDLRGWIRFAYFNIEEVTHAVEVLIRMAWIENNPARIAIGFNDVPQSLSNK